MLRIPAEIYGQIAGLLGRSDLANLSRVSPASQGESNRLLYRDVDFSALPVDFLGRDAASRRASDRPIDIFFNTIATSPAHAATVTSFSLRLPYQPSEGVDPQKALQAMTNLRRLTVVSVLFEDAFPSFLHACTTELHELDVGLAMNDDLFEFLSRRPNIHQVTVGKEKIPYGTETGSYKILLPSREQLLPGVTKLRAIEGAVPLALMCPSLKELDLAVSECQDFSLVMDVMASVGKQLTRLRCHRSLFYGSDALVQHLSWLAQATPNLESLEILEHFCGGWGNPPCEQYLSGPDSLGLDGEWTKLKTITWTSHLSCHDHLVYWQGGNLCDRVFEALPSVVALKYTEECLVEVNSSVTFSYQRIGATGTEWKEVYRADPNPSQGA